jgi:hypothetical protein
MTYLRAKIVQTKQMYPEREVELMDIGSCYAFSLWGILFLNSFCCIALNPLYHDKPKINDTPKTTIHTIFSAKP